MSVQKIIKIGFISLALLFSIIIGAMIIIPNVYKEEIFDLIKQEAEKNVDAFVDIEDLNISFFKNFPKPSIEFIGMHIRGKNKFQDISLLDIDRASAQIDIRSLLKYEEGIRIRKVAVKNAHFNIRVLNDGSANYDIVPESSAENSSEPKQEESTALNIELKELSLKNINLTYQDDEGDIRTSIKGLNTEGYINIDNNGYLFKSKSNIQDIDLAFEGIQYLSNAKIKAQIDCLADLDNMKFTLQKNEVFLNALQLRTNGFVQLADESIDMDLNFEAPGNEFREIFSLIPSAYISGYEEVQFDGEFMLKGAVKGRLQDENFPAIELDVNIKNGFFQYPELPFPVEQINVKVDIEKEAGSLDKLILGLPTFSLSLQEQSFGGKFLLKTPLSNPDMDLDLIGILDLHSFAKAFPLEDVNALTGILNTNVHFKGNFQQFEQERYQDMDVKGSIMLSDFSTQAYQYPTISIEKMIANFSPQAVILEDFKCLLGKSDLAGNARIDNLLAYFNPDQSLKGELILRSENLDMNEWIVENEKEEPSEAEGTIAPAAPADEAMTALAFDRFNFRLDALIKNIQYDSYQLKNLKTKGQLNAHTLKADVFSVLLEDSDIRFEGQLDNIFGFVLNEELLQGNLRLESERLNLNPFLVSDETGIEETASSTASEEENYEVLIIPKNISLNMSANAGKILYEDIVLDNFQGELNIKEGRLIMDKCAANSMGGAILITGAYDCNNPEDPTFNFKFELEQIDFSKAFSSLNTFQQLAPIGQYVQGTFNTSLVMDGKMDSDMMPELSTLNAQGFLHTLQGEIEEFEPLSALDQKLNLNVFSGISIKDTKNWFDIKNGLVEVQEFDVKHKDVDMKISGTHSIEQDMNYLIKMKIPKEVYDQGLSGELVDGAYGLLNQQAAKLGLKVDQAESLNINMSLSGNIKEPKVGMKLVGSSEGAQDAGLKEGIARTVEEEKEALKEDVKAEIDELKEQLKEEADSTMDALKDQVKEEADKKKEELKKEADKILKEQLKKARLDSIAKEKAKKAEEELKKKLEEFNPFKKKKKKDN